MIKKISTLFFALVALLGTTNVFAQTAVQSLSLDGNPGLYQIAVGNGVSNTQVLALDTLGNIVTVNPSTVSALVPFANTLWCVEVNTVEQGKGFTFDFLNKGYEAYLDITMDGLSGLAPATNSGPMEVGGEIAGWAFSTVVENNLETGKPLYSYFTADSIVGLQVLPSGAVGVRKYAANDANVNVNTTDFSIFTLQEAAMITLNEQQINSVLDTQSKTAGVALTFKPDVIGTTLENPFTAAKFVVEHAAGDYMYVKRGTNYLRVDSAYTNDMGNSKFLAYNWVTKEQLDALIAGPSNANQAKFKFEYYPSVDSLVIRVNTVTTEASYGNANNAPNWTASGTFTNGYDWFVSLQELVKGSTRILTVEQSQNTLISLGFTGCVASNNRTSLAEDLYLITDGKDRYLAMPIYGDGRPQWVTVNPTLENPWNMPAYQWVVEKTRTSTEELQKTSPITITNREYGVRVGGTASYQLYNDGTATPLIGVAGNTQILITEDSFIKDTQDVKKNPYIGYKTFDEDSVLVLSYNFRYLHELSDKAMLALGKDSIVEGSLESKLDFTIKKDFYQNVGNSAPYLRDTTYGYTGNRVKNIVKLHRKAYILQDKNSEQYLMIDKEKRYALSSYVTTSTTSTAPNPVGIFYLKENNYKDGISYYALVDINNQAIIDRSSQQPQDDEYYNYRKLSLQDQTLLAQAEEMREKRTSAFAITFDETPLYRRFNTTDEMDAPEEGGEGEDARAATVVDDERVFLKFYMTYRDEYLQVENNKKGEGFIVDGIDFLGMWNADNAGSGLSFQVDTAWVNRGLGYIKPQYLISIERKDFNGQPAKPCEEADHGYAQDGTPYDKWTCPHATRAIPGYSRGKYLVNTNLLVGRNWNGNKSAEDLMWRIYDRAAFVDAIQVTDTLFIPKQLNSYYTLPNEKVNIDSLRQVAAANPKTGADYSGMRNTTGYIIVYLDGDNHKYATWSMRFVDPEKAVAGQKEFLIESMNANGSGTLGSGASIAPEYAQWVKLQNGVLTLSDPKTSAFSNMNTSGDDALIFDVQKGSEADKPLDNTNVDASAVTVIAETGAVVIKNAAGKKVAISNILGQTVANTVITSDNATIAVPQGVVVVAVEGEAAVKAIVK